MNGSEGILITLFLMALVLGSFLGSLCALVFFNFLHGMRK